MYHSLKSSLLLIILALFVLAACTATPQATETEEPVATEEAATGITIVLADISDDPDKKIRRFQPLADYIAANIDGVSSGEVRIAPTMDVMIDWIENGEVDFYFDSIYPAMLISDATGARPILRRWKDGVGEYHSVFFTLEGSDITSLEDLQGQVVAFDEPFSTSGYMLPLSLIVNAGFTATELDTLSADVADDEIGYVFSGDDDNTFQWVISEQVPAGVTDSDNFTEISEDSDLELAVIVEGDPVPRQVALVRAGLDEELVAEITALLLAMTESEEGLAVLDEFDTSQFDGFPGGIEQAMTDMRDMFELAQGQ